MRTTDSLTTINNGMGRDSFTMLCLLDEGRLVVDGEPLRPEDVDAVIFSDPGAEWDHTYALLPRAAEICARLGVRFIVLRKPPEAVWKANLRAKGERAAPVWCQDDSGTIEEKAARGYYHRRLPIIQEFRRFAKIPVTVNASCTENHKVSPIRRVMDDLALERFGIDNRRWSYEVRKGLRPKHRVLIGIAADEESRAIDTGRPIYERPVYPLVEQRITKADEAPILARHGLAHVRKSGCKNCPYQPVGWYWVLRETDSVGWAEAVDLEAAALAENPKMWQIGTAKKPLPQAVEDWRAKNPRATIESVLAKEYSRCVVSKAQQAVLLQAEVAPAKPTRTTSARPPRRAPKVEAPTRGEQGGLFGVLIAAGKAAIGL